MPHQAPWLIFLLPFLSLIIISFILRPFFNNRPKLGGYVAIGAIGISFILSLWVLLEVLAAPGHKLEIPDIQWLVIGDLSVQVGLLVDSLTAVMLVVVSLVSLMVQIYSQGYMHGDPGYHRYFAFMSLFTACMLGLVMADNLVFMFLFWEGVGLGSYLLIGFWFHRPSAANAAKKAFIVTRFGDFGFLAAILLLFYNTGTFNIEELHSLAIAGVLAGTTLTWAALGIFSGAVGKSAQFPLHVWLPDAMEGPTPVSALIHAATMVAAGVFLVARFFPLFEHSHAALTTVAVIGGFTAIFAASMGLVMTDIKRVLAYSTISQLGYMMLGLGVGGVAVGIFHLFNHAFFKALLFLGAGSVNHSTGTFDMREMGGLRKAMPWTYITFLIASLSIAGIWPLSGFWSKDEILAYSFTNNPILFYLAIITVFMTAFYMFRAVFITFGGEYRGGAASSSHSGHGHGKLHESPMVMVVPMVILAVLSVASGWLNVTGSFSQFLGHGGDVEVHSFIGGFFGMLTHPLPLISLLVAGLGIFLAYAMYSAKWLSAEAVGRVFKPLHTLFSRKYWFDELYERVIVVRVLVDGIFAALSIFDSRIVDGAVNGVARGTNEASGVMRRTQTGQLQAYGIAIAIGVIAIAVCFYLFG
ncbi:MAG: NADH-quinone oxidoreductase subunit L [Chloroflexi bacterium RBG_19FT_COMBO_48_23]|nr:MAG: NADH-quinone oxidoreductase subunit L [Chloroflexi bacterium RBG_19FT_COMBO_48_23]